MKKFRVLSLLIAIAMLLAMAGCQSAAPAPSNAATVAPAATDAPATSSEPEPKGEPAKISYYRAAPNNTKLITNWSDAVWIQTLEEKMNVKFDFQGPAAGEDYNQAANVMLASGTLTDMFYHNFNNYDGGLSAAIADGIAIDFSKNEKYKALVPNWFALLDSNEAIRRSVTLDDGTSALFCHVDTDLRRGAYWGLGIRSDWLKKVNKQTPTSIDELYDVLVAFRDQDPNGNGQKDEIGITDYNLGGGTWFFTLSDIISAYGLLYQETQIDPTTGKVNYWIAVNDGKNFQELVTTLNKWYTEKLLDPEWSVQDGTAQDAKVTGDRVGVLHIWPSNFNIFQTALRKTNPDATFEGLTPLKGPDGKPYSPNSALVRPAASTEGTVVTPQAEKDGVAEACFNLINFMYSQEGSDIINWGKEGVSYTVGADGKKAWTDEVSKDPEFTINDKVNKYAIPTFGSWPKLMSYEAWGSIELNTPESTEAHKRWATGDGSLCLPNLTLSAQESKDYAKIMNDVKTAIVENFIKFVVGQRPISEVPQVVQQCKDMGLEDAMKLYQGAYDRYMAK